MQDKHSRSRSLFLDSLSLSFPKNDVYYYYYHTTTTTTTTTTITTTTLHTTTTSNTNLLYSTIKKKLFDSAPDQRTEKASKNRGGMQQLFPTPPSENWRESQG